jgi:hypothetical protein
MVNLGSDYHVKTNETVQRNLWQPSPFILHIQEITTEHQISTESIMYNKLLRDLTEHRGLTYCVVLISCAMHNAFI